MSTPVTIGAAVVAVVVIGGIGTQWPEIRRYLRVRSM
jgi:hypothetical protein